MDISNLIKITGIIIFLFSIVLVPVIIGQRLGSSHIRRTPDLKDAPVGTVVAAALGTLAFLLAFIFQIAADRFADRKELLLDDVTGIRKTYLQAGLIAEPIRSETRKLLVEYVDLRLELARDTTKLRYALSRSQQILDTLWSYSEKLASADRSSEVYSLYTVSVNDLVDIFNKRVTMTLEYRIPSIIIWILFVVVFFSMLTLGYQFGISGRGNLMINSTFAIIFAVIMFLIISLDRPEAGLAKLDQKPMITLQKQLQVRQAGGN
jgi:hypothetical protein